MIHRPPRGSFSARQFPPPLRLAALVLGGVLLWGRPAPAATPAAADAARVEEQVKAAFLYNFAKFVTWPRDSQSLAPGDSLVIGAVGPSGVGEALRGAVQGRLVKGHPVAIHLFRDAGDLTPCQMLYVGRTDAAELAALLKHGPWRGVLTVGETDAFLAFGGVIRFLITDDRVGFVVNLKAATQNDLEVSSAMLKVAQRVITEPPAGGR